MARRREVDKKLRKKIKNYRNGIKIVYDPKVAEHYQPNVILHAPDLRENMPLPAIAQR